MHHTRHAFARTDAISLVALTASATLIAPALIAAAPLSAARDRCMLTQALLATGQALYMAEHDDQYAGVNTSGAVYQGFGLGPTGIVVYSDELLFDTSATTPTTTWDWLSPTMGDKGRFSENRALRTAELLDRFACPEATRFNDDLFASPDTEDAQDFAEVFKTLGFRQVSYLQPAGFHFYSSAATNIPHSRPGSLTRLKQGPAAPVTTPADFRPVLDRVGDPARKILHADGTRFLGSDQRLDIDISPDPQAFSFFASSSPIVNNSRAYGRAVDAAPANHELSFRHANAINAAMFDGSVRRIPREQAWTDPRPWFPAGSLFNGESATPESTAFAKKNLDAVPGGYLIQ